MDEVGAFLSFQWMTKDGRECATTTTTISSREGEIGCRRRLRAADVSFFEYELVEYAYTHGRVVRVFDCEDRRLGARTNERTDERTVSTDRVDERQSWVKKHGDER